MNCLNAIIDGQIDPPQDDEHCYTYVLPGAERVTANTIFDLWYQEGADYDYTQEPNNRDAGKSIDRSHVANCLSPPERSVCVSTVVRANIFVEPGR